MVYVMTNIPCNFYLGQCSRLDVTFVVDVSEGVVDSRNNMALSAAEQIINDEWNSLITDRDEGIQLACVSVGDRSEIEFYLGRHNDYVYAADYISRILYRGTSNDLQYSLELVEEIYRRGETANSNLVIIISYGSRVDSESSLIRVKEEMERRGFYFFTIYIDVNNRNGNQDLIQRMASDRYYTTFSDMLERGREDYSMLRYLTSSICSGQYMLGQDVFTKCNPI